MYIKEMVMKGLFLFHLKYIYDYYKTYIYRDKLANIMCDNSSESIFIVDVYNSDLWPRDKEAAQAINISMRLHCGTTDEDYMDYLKYVLQKFEKEYISKTDIIFFNAGSDVLKMDPLGRMEISPECLCKRDEAVFDLALRYNKPIVYVLSGGYAKGSARLICNSIENLITKFDLISLAKKNFAINL